MKNELYRRLAADGNKDAKNILGAFPVSAVDEDDSEELEEEEEEGEEDVEALDAQIAALTAKRERLRANAGCK